MSEEKIHVQELASHFKKSLENLYPVKEIEQFMVMTFESVLDFSRIDLIIRKEEIVRAKDITTFKKVIARLKKFEPIQYILGQVVFYGIPLKVNSDVLIPRPETEELVRWILDDHMGTEIEIMDVCTGSGCIALALKNLIKDAKVHGVDKSVKALNMASQNATLNKIGVDFFLFDVLEQQSFGFMQFDVMVSNPPYVRETEKLQMDENVLGHEPHLALFVNDDTPLVFYRNIVELAAGHLKNGGHLYFEINEAYGKEVMQLLEDHLYTDCQLRNDLNGRARMVRGTKS